MHRATNKTARTNPEVRSAGALCLRVAVDPTRRASRSCRACGGSTALSRTPKAMGERPHGLRSARGNYLVFGRSLLCCGVKFRVTSATGRLALEGGREAAKRQTRVPTARVSCCSPNRRRDQQASLEFQNGLLFGPDRSRPRKSTISVTA
jgi:hypothetical protein